MSSNSRAEILKAIRSRDVPASPLPDLAGHWIRYPDRAAQFRTMLEFVGGQCHFVRNLAEAQQRLDSLAPYQSAKKVVSLVPELGRPNVGLDSIEDPHALEDVDFAILRGEFAVAENGAIWITDQGVKQRVVYFLTQHLSLVVPASEMVDNMHDAYERLRFQGRGFGAFISGPSKTADIEQSLVIGAHGARSLTVFLVG